MERADDSIGIYLRYVPCIVMYKDTPNLIAVNRQFLLSGMSFVTILRRQLQLAFSPVLKDSIELLLELASGGD